MGCLRPVDVVPEGNADGFAGPSEFPKAVAEGVERASEAIEERFCTDLGGWPGLVDAGISAFAREAWDGRLLRTGNLDARGMPDGLLKATSSSMTIPCGRWSLQCDSCAWRDARAIAVSTLGCPLDPMS